VEGARELLDPRLAVAEVMAAARVRSPGDGIKGSCLVGPDQREGVARIPEAVAEGDDPFIRIRLQRPLAEVR
jgi:hypothetical protein